MASRDDELERLKRRRMLELQKRMLRESQKPEEPPEPEGPTPDTVFNAWFEGRAWEVLRAARTQFPKVMPQVEGALLEALKAGRVKQKIDGESLFQFLRQIGVPVRLQTSIRYKDHGELKTIGQLMKERE
ncbi:MAG: hypothetical protein JSV27_08115 [Candidatus Bathyarchaeota archaeon]|nr:MAG: hypothetical protein JSV27_08115 [Candidatus Bathyarchaeota archaeon]